MFSSLTVSGMAVFKKGKSLRDCRRRAIRSLHNFSRWILCLWETTCLETAVYWKLHFSPRTPKNYKNWATGDPNNGGTYRKKDEDCAVLKSDGKWNDYPCNTLFKYICKARASRWHKILRWLPLILSNTTITSCVRATEVCWPDQPLTSLAAKPREIVGDTQWLILLPLETRNLVRDSTVIVKPVRHHQSSVVPH